MSSGEEILARLEEDGRILLFIDESGTSEKPLPELEKDFMVYCGVEFYSESYSNICKRMNDKLSSISSDVQEFHATEIVNPKKKSPWYKASCEERIDSLLLLSELVDKYCTIAPYCYISKEQYNLLVAGTLAEKLTHKEGLKKVFFNSVLSINRIKNKKYAVIFDSEKKLDNEIKIQSVSLERDLLYEDGIILASSITLPGLQLADYAVYILNRIHHSAHRIKTGKRNIFDEVIIESANILKPKYMDLLKK
ncbi:MAG: DUF3800 domain-containing protein [gamma proteobacterium symbiont of Taylorina sp.]|nr:DUF3800 domain-containing protein [gamma proteobacterium symbiont of Taylorina sp.]